MFDITLSPGQVELLAKPGITITQGYDVINNSDSNIMVNASVRPWEPSGTTGQVSYTNVMPNPGLEFSLANSDIQLGRSFLLKPGQKQQLVLKIKTADNIPLADSYYTFFVSQDTANFLDPDQVGAQTSAEIGSHLLLSTSDSENLVAQASISRLSAKPQLKDILLSKITFSGYINNESDHFFKADGKLTISKNGLVLQELKLFPRNILANYSRQIDCLQDNEPVSCTISPPFWPGAYTATIESNHASASINFFVFPFSILIFLGLTILTIIICINLFRPKSAH